MALTIRLAGRVDENGVLHLRSVAAWRAAIARQKGRDVWVAIGRPAKNASHDQHGYYRAVVLPLLAEEWGWDDRDELHFRLKERHIPRELWMERRIGSDVESMPPSSGELTMEQFSAYLTAVITHATLEGVIVPEPHQIEVGGR